jgi:antitoxin MazE
MRTSVQKWGNSLGIRIPKIVAEEAALQAGSVVELFRDADAIVVRLVRNRKPRYRLEELARKINAKNRHAEVTSGRPRGREAW